MNKDYSIVLPTDLYHEIRANLLAEPEEETAAFLLAGIHEGTSGVRLLARRMLTIPRNLYRQKLAYHLDIAPEAINGLARLCEANNLSAILCHSHPGQAGRLQYSTSDDHGEARLAKFLQNYTNARPIGSLLFSESDVVGRVWDRGHNCTVTRISALGDILRVITSKGKGLVAPISESHVRQVVVLGEEGQRTLRACKIAVIGVGGTGSCVAEQLTRLGVGSIILVDDDHLEESNISRMYGSFPRSLKKTLTDRIRGRRVPKVNVVGAHLRSISPKLNVEAVHGNVVASHIAKQVVDCDLIMLCTDEHWSRSVVNQISYQYYIPVVNMGVRVDAPRGVITAAAGDVHTLGPGKPCLWCYGYLSADRIAAESMLPEQRTARIREGYVEGIGQAPMVISLTSTVASLAVTEMLHILTGFREERSIRRLKWDILSGRIWPGDLQVPEKCLCKNVLGHGDSLALPTHDDPDFVRRCRGMT